MFCRMGRWLMQHSQDLQIRRVEDGTNSDIGKQRREDLVRNKAPAMDFNCVRQQARGRGVPRELARLGSWVDGFGVCLRLGLVTTLILWNVAPTR